MPFAYRFTPCRHLAFGRRTSTLRAPPSSKRLSTLTLRRTVNAPVLPESTKLAPAWLPRMYLRSAAAVLVSGGILLHVQTSIRNELRGVLDRCLAIDALYDSINFSSYSDTAAYFHRLVLALPGIAPDAPLGLDWVEGEDVEVVHAIMRETAAEIHAELDSCDLMAASLRQCVAMHDKIVRLCNGVSLNFETLFTRHLDDSIYTPREMVEDEYNLIM
ncbi:hypothetical protein CYLTODRAFT_494897 [Cylindrobasidium torrendii FP15055 ss-10]|uniref:Uncharacterized protein n=1 Tax=Cylindrobasidium torrendii FP15055 ss-10 TaxID=1314674 RepID=A0A0D7AXR6_9AGAR|nr:hypothetical protein CYLTODRAFT_494897 [Cylindrobasidium torrendii FP15055 ss-10]